MYSWAGQRLKVYLTEGKIVKEPLSEEYRMEYLGGRGFNSKVLLDEVPPGTDPLSPENVFIVSSGTLVGTPAPTAARWTVTAKSPITSGFGDGNGGGDFAAALKYAGYDQVIFYGKSPKPVYLYIDDDRVTLRDASHLWGKTLSIMQNMLVTELRNPEIIYLGIGPAAENLVLITKMLCNTRAGGKGGMGAVAGSKNLKAIVVKGTKSIKVANPTDFYALARRAYQKILASPFRKTMRSGGSLNWTAAEIQKGALPTRNSQSGYFEGWENLTADVYMKKYMGRRLACFACPIHCTSYYEVKDGPFATYGSNPQHGTIYPFTAKLGIDDFEFALKASTECNELGLDTHLTGATLSFAMEAWQRGFITSKDTNGLDLTWGNTKDLLQLIHNIAYRKGFGDVLAGGSKKASEQIPGSEVCLVQVKGMDASHMYPGPAEGREWQLAYSTAARGPDHLRGTGGYGKGNPRVVKILGEEGAKALLDPQSYKGAGVNIALSNYFGGFLHSLGLCTRSTVFYGMKHALLDEFDLAELFTAATGMEMTGDELMKIGERVTNVERLFNVREGFGREEDYPPAKFFFEGKTDGPIIAGPVGIDRVKYGEMLDEYYTFNGWDHEGIPARKKLDELNLGKYAQR